MKLKPLNFLIIIIGIFISIISESLRVFFISNLVLLLTYLIFTFLTQSKFIRLFQIWILAFLYIVIPEGIIYSYLLEVNPYVFTASKYICLSNWMVLLAHNIFYNESLIDQSSNIKKHYNIGFTFLLTFGIIYSIFLVVNVPHAIKIMRYGRVGDMTATLHPIVIGTANAAGHIIPSVIAFYFKNIKKSHNYLFKSLLYSLPIFIVLFLGGTRFHLLFSFGGMLLVLYAQSKINLIKIIKVLPAIIFLALGSKMMVAYRAFGLKDGALGLILNTFFSKKEGNSGLLSSIEGLIYQSSVMVEYFTTHPYMKGISSSFILYFWIPRNLWPEKPQMLGYWLMREAKGTYGFSKGHSFSFGFMGDAYADFGFYGGLLFCFFLGMLLAKFDTFTKNQINNSTRFSLIIAAMSYSYIFFFVRSPLTATFNFIGIAFVFLIIRYSLKGYFILK